MIRAIWKPIVVSLEGQQWNETPYFKDKFLSNLGSRLVFTWIFWPWQQFCPTDPVIGRRCWRFPTGWFRSFHRLVGWPTVVLLVGGGFQGFFLRKSCSPLWGKLMHFYQVAGSWNHSSSDGPEKHGVFLKKWGLIHGENDRLHAIYHYVDTVSLPVFFSKMVTYCINGGCESAIVVHG